MIYIALMPEIFILNLIMIKQSENNPDDRNFSKAFFFLGNLKKVDFIKHRQETKLRNKTKLKRLERYYNYHKQFLIESLI